MTSDFEDHVLGADGRFHAVDGEVRLSIYGWEDWIVLAVFWILACVVFYQVFTRYVLNDAAGWTEEIARYLLIAVTFLGGAMAVRRNTHIQVDFVYRFLPRAEGNRSEEHTSELQSHVNLVCRLLLEKKKKISNNASYKK